MRAIIQLGNPNVSNRYAGCKQQMNKRGDVGFFPVVIMSHTGQIQNARRT